MLADSINADAATITKDEAIATSIITTTITITEITITTTTTIFLPTTMSFSC